MKASGSGSGKTSASLVGPAAAAPRHQTVVSALAAAAAGKSGLTFIDAREQEQVLTFAELFERARKTAAGLAGLGVRPGDRVALVLPTGPDFMDALFGALCAGAVPVPLYPPLRLGRMEEFHARTTRMLEVTGARVLLSDARVSRLLGVDLVMATWVQKVSELILNLNVQILDVKTQKLVLVKSVDMRGNTDESWTRAVHYLVRDMAEKRALNPRYAQ